MSIPIRDYAIKIIDRLDFQTLVNVSNVSQACLGIS